MVSKEDFILNSHTLLRLEMMLDSKVQELIFQGKL